jgi:hypothetical protein
LMAQQRGPQNRELLVGLQTAEAFLGSRGARAQPRIVDATEKCLDGGEIDRDNFRRNLAMRFSMDVCRSGRVRRVDKAEAGAALRVVPVREAFDLESWRPSDTVLLFWRVG